MLLTGCWEVGCLWSKVGHGHLRCLPWWRRISTQTVWLLKMETSLWAADTGVGQQLIQTHLQHALLIAPKHYCGLHLWTAPPSTSFPEYTILPSPFLSSHLLHTMLMCQHVVDSIFAGYMEPNTPSIKWAVRHLHPGDVWLAACTCLSTVSTCVCKRTARGFWVKIPKITE